MGQPRGEALNQALEQGKDLLGERVIAEGGAAYENMKDFLPPLFYSTGASRDTFDVHHVLYAADGGEPPRFVAVADGSRICAERYDADRLLEFHVGSGEAERYGGNLDRLEGPSLEGGYYPILRTGYTDEHGIRYAQESFGSWISGLDAMVLFVKLSVRSRQETAIRIRLGGGRFEDLRYSGTPEQDDNEFAYAFREGSEPAVYLLWSPDNELPENTPITAEAYESAKNGCKAHWDRMLASGAQFVVPEQIVMDCQRNLLIQNKMLRWRYSLGAVVYHDSFYQPESSDAMSTLAMYGFSDAARDGLRDLMGMTKGEKYYVNWERGERLCHGAHYYLLTRDAAFIEEHAEYYASLCDELKTQMEADPNGLLERQRHCGDIAEVSYCTFHQAVCWRGLRDMADVWKLVGRADLHARYAPVAANLKHALYSAIAQSQQTLPDNTLFVPSMLLEEEQEIYDPVTATRMGGYWNLCMPYAFASGLWDVNGPDMDGIVRYLHNHGAILLGLLRFDLYPTPNGEFRSTGLPGYCSAGFDNVYLPSYMRLMSDRDDAERLLVSFYGKLCHGQTRGTFVSGEGDTAAPRPAEKYRSAYGSCNSANNLAFLLALRLILVRESFDDETGLPQCLFLAHATPRGWLEQGKRIEVSNAPTCFGEVSYALVSDIANGKVTATVHMPERNAAQGVRLRLRLPGGRRIRSVAVNGVAHKAFDAKQEVIDLTGFAGELDVKVRCG